MASTLMGALSSSVGMASQAFSLLKSTNGILDVGKKTYNVSRKTLEPLTTVIILARNGVSEEQVKLGFEK